jgi:hypothetical protein
MIDVGVSSCRISCSLAKSPFDGMTMSGVGLDTLPGPPPAVRDLPKVSIGKPGGLSGHPHGVAGIFRATAR